MHTLLDVMTVRKPYLDPGLTIYSLAQMMEIPAHQLSRLLNIHMNQSFFEFINRYRVNEFKSILNKKEFSHYSMLALALEAGFNSKASFNRIFKQITNSTPSEYRKKMSQ
jgi:transcriptional regulator GlxA family with amidase domain